MKTLFTSACVAVAATAVMTASAQEISVYVDGNRLNTQYPPVVRDGRTMMFLRDTFDSLGAVVQWFPNERKIKAWQADTEIELWIGRNIAYVNGESVMLDAPPVIENYRGMGGRTLVPLRFISEALGAEVVYNDMQHRVDITTDAMGIWHETEPAFAVGNTVQVLDPERDRWITARVLEVIVVNNGLDRYRVEYTDHTGRLTTGTFPRSQVRASRN